MAFFTAIAGFGDDTAIADVEILTMSFAYLAIDTYYALFLFSNLAKYPSSVSNALIFGLCGVLRYLTQNLSESIQKNQVKFGEVASIPSKSVGATIRGRDAEEH